MLNKYAITTLLAMMTTLAFGQSTAHNHVNTSSHANIQHVSKSPTVHHANAKAQSHSHIKAKQKTTAASAQHSIMKAADDTPYSPPTVGNKELLRSTVSLSHNVYVDPYSGRLVIHIPLVNIPLNDGLHLRVTLSNYFRHATGKEGFSFPYSGGKIAATGAIGYHFQIVPGISFFTQRTDAGFFPQKALKFAFLDPAGNMHLFTLSSGLTYYSKDNWKAVLEDTGTCLGYIMSPNGSRYDMGIGQAGICPLTKITSPHGGASISYSYGGDSTDNLTLERISASNGYSLSFQYTNPIMPHVAIGFITGMNDNHGRKWQFSYTADNLKLAHGTGPILSNITLPDTSHWAIASNSDNPDKITSPTGLVATVTHHGDSPWPFGRSPLITDQIVYSGQSIAHELILNYQYKSNFTTVLNGDVTGPNGFKFTKTFTYQHSVIQAGDAGPNPLHVYYYPSWNNGLPTSETTTDAKQNVVKTVKYNWGYRTINGDNGLNLPELNSRTITQDGTTYTKTYSNFDSFGYPQTEVDSSPFGSITTKTTYYTNSNNWIFTPETITTYDANNNPINQVSKTFNSSGEMLTKTINGVTTTYTYDNGGNIASITDALGNTSKFSNYLTGFAQQQTDPMGNVYQYTLDNDGVITSFIDPLGNKTTYTYDSMLRPISITPPIHAATTIAWNTLSPSSEVLTRGNYQMTTLNNAYGSPIKLEKKDTKTGADITINTQYDALDRPVFTSYANSTDGIAKTYDTLGRVLTISQPVAASGSTALTTPTYTKTFAYEKNNVTAVTDPNGNQATYQYRAFANPDDKQLMSVTQANGTATTITRNLLGQILSIQQGKLTRRYDYNTNHYLTEVDNPETGKTLLGRNIIGELTSKQVGSSGAIDYAYNADGKITTITYPKGTLTAPTVTKTYDKAGQLTNISNGTSQWAYAYDANGNLTTSTLSIGSKTYAPITATYDDLDHLASLNYFNKETVTYAPNALGQATEALPYVKQISYFPNGDIQTYTDGNGIVTTYTQNARQMPNSITVTNAGGTPMLQRQYTYDGDNNVLSITDPLDSSDNQSFTYNNVNWLMSAAGLWGKASYTYSTNGDILTKDVGSEQLSFTYDPTTDLLQSTTGTKPETITHDAFGNINAIGSEAFSFNTADQLAKATGTNPQGEAVNDQYQYDANGHRLIVTTAQQSSPKYEVYSRTGKLLYQGPLDGTGTDYIYLAGHQVAKSITESQGTRISYFHNNLLSSPLATTNSSGNFNWQQRYQPYGQTIEHNTGQPETHIGFTGKPHDDNSGLSNYGARYYSPLLNRFISPDPAPVNPMQPITFNRFDYAADSPYRYIDPTGMSFESDINNTMGAINGMAGGMGSGIAHSISFGAVNLSYNHKSKADSIAHTAGEVFGAGLAVVGGEAAAVARGGEAVADTTVKTLGKSFYRSMSKAEAEAIKETGKLRGGNPGETFFTDSRYKAASRAQDRLSLPNRPEVQMEFKIKNNPIMQRNGTKVAPGFGGTGGGKEYMSTDPVKVEVINVQPY